MKDTTYRSIPAVGTGDRTPCPYFIKLEYAVNDTSWRSQPQRINEFAKARSNVKITRSSSALTCLSKRTACLYNTAISLNKIDHKKMWVSSRILIYPRMH